MSVGGVLSKWCTVVCRKTMHQNLAKPISSSRRRSPLGWLLTRERASSGCASEYVAVNRHVLPIHLPLPSPPPPTPVGGTCRTQTPS